MNDAKQRAARKGRTIAVTEQADADAVELVAIKVVDLALGRMDEERPAVARGPVAGLVDFRRREPQARPGLPERDRFHRRLLS